jgi:hypothetical protein
VYALPGALDAVLALDRPGMLDDAIALHEFTAGDRLDRPVPGSDGAAAALGNQRRRPPGGRRA